MFSRIFSTLAVQTKGLGASLLAAMNSWIAAMRSHETVKTHLKRLYEKLGVSDRAQAVAIALRQNLIE